MKDNVSINAQMVIFKILIRQSMLRAVDNAELIVLPAKMRSVLAMLVKLVSLLMLKIPLTVQKLNVLILFVNYVRPLPVNANNATKIKVLYIRVIA